MDRRRLPRVQVAHKLRTESWLHMVQGRQRIGPEAHQVLVSLIQGHARDTRMAWVVCLHPGGEQGGLARACGGRYQGERASDPLIEQTRQARTGDELMRGGRYEELGRYQRCLPRHLVLVTLHSGRRAFLRWWMVRRDC